MNYRLWHKTEYAYSDLVSHAVNQACVTPMSLPGQRCLDHQVRISPEPAYLGERTDRFGNRISCFLIESPHRKLVIESRAIVQTSDPGPLPASPRIDTLPELLRGHSQDELLAIDCLLPSLLVPDDPVVAHYADALSAGHSAVLEFATALTERIYTDFTYDPGFSSVLTPIAHVIEERRGVCQDFAHVAIAVCRRLGVPARYVSGYLETLPPPGEPKQVGADATHAWFGVYVPGHGWFDFDPTNNQRPDAQYITTAIGRDYDDVAPVKGIVYGGGVPKLSVAVDVARME